MTDEEPKEAADLKLCCGVKLVRNTKGVGHIVERYECKYCGDIYSPYLGTIYSKGGTRHIKYSDAKVADCLEGQITWIREEKP